jgi:hypothetical protein
MGVIKPLRGVKTKLVGLSIMLTVNVAQYMIQMGNPGISLLRSSHQKRIYDMGREPSASAWY